MSKFWLQLSLSEFLLQGEAPGRGFGSKIITPLGQKRLTARNLQGRKIFTNAHAGLELK
jgi:hypothetical protein